MEPLGSILHDTVRPQYILLNDIYTLAELVDVLSGEARLSPNLLTLFSHFCWGYDSDHGPILTLHQFTTADEKKNRSTGTGGTTRAAWGCRGIDATICGDFTCGRP